MKHYVSKIAVVILSSLAVAGGLRAGPTAADVDAETFGHSALYMGAASGFETLAQPDDCPAATPTPSPCDETGSGANADKLQPRQYLPDQIAEKSDKERDLSGS